MPKAKIVFGDAAARFHQNGYSDEDVALEGTIQEIEFNTQAELDAYLKGVEDMDGWAGYCLYDPRNLRVDDEDEEDDDGDT